MAAPPADGLKVEKVREAFQLAPWGLSFSGVRGREEIREQVWARNLTGTPREIRSVRVVGEGAALFRVRTPETPVVLPPKGSLSVDLLFKPPARSPPGVFRAKLRFQSGAEIDDGPATDLTALVLATGEATDEPPLQAVIDALGFAVDVGGGGRVLPPSPVGQEIREAALFERAKPGPVAVNPVARFEPDEPLPFGPYRAEAGAPPVRETLGVLARGQNQKLNPELETGGGTSFDPGEGPFGIWVGGAGHEVFSENARNERTPRRASRDRRPIAAPTVDEGSAELGRQPASVRLYPLRARGGTPVLDAYLIAFGDRARGEYQDCVFVLWNVRLVHRP